MSSAAHVYLTPGDVMKSLGVSSSTFRRLSQDFETVFPPLERDANNRRHWTLEAAQLLQQAHQAVEMGAAPSYLSALEALRDGRGVPTRGQLPLAQDPGAALDDLRVLVQSQGESITQLLTGLNERDAELVSSLRALADAQVQQTRAIQALQVRVEANARSAPTPSARPRSLLVRLLLTVLGQ